MVNISENNVKPPKKQTVHQQVNVQLKISNETRQFKLIFYPMQQFSYQLAIAKTKIQILKGQA
jgi:hypothetical protein